MNLEYCCASMKEAEFAEFWLVVYDIRYYLFKISY
tara:strand:+ start:576 stop:680 length:105 start_codon:yes stop_codon:yes gene_type:complete